MGSVRFSYNDIKSVPLPRRKFLKGFIEDLFVKEGRKLTSLSYVFTSDKYVLELNKRHLRHNYFTDILTFDLSHSVGEIEGEVYISVERVKENAVVHLSAVEEELLRVIFHGALHLCGYRDKKKSEITIMRRKEEEYLRLFKQQSANRST